MMLRRAFAGLALAALAGAPLAGCSSDDGGGSGTAAAAAPTASGTASAAAAPKKKVKATKATIAWAGRVCHAMPAGVTNSKMPKINVRDVAASERTIAAYMDGMAKRLGTVKSKLEGAGAPPTADGKSVLSGAISDLEATQKRLRDAAKALRTTKPGTPAFQAAQKSAGEAMRGLGGYRPPTRALRDSPAVGDGFAHAAPCKRPGV